MDKLKIALVGIGGISQVVRIPILKKMDDVELVALCDVDGAKVSFIAEKNNIPNFYIDIQELLSKEKLDGILICTPNNLHYPMALARLEKGIHTLVEKPVALNAEQTERMVNIAKSKNVHLVCGMYYRFRYDAVILKDFMLKNEIGKPFYVKSGWLRDWARGVQTSWLYDKKISGRFYTERFRGGSLYNA
jgi:predicted dehydrogenase